MTPAPDRGVLIYNPSSGQEDHETQVRSLAANASLKVRCTAAEGDGVDLTREAVEDGASLVVAAGGDGTVNEVVNGLYDANALEQTVLAVIPTGTGNNFAANVGIVGLVHDLDGQGRRGTGLDDGFGDDGDEVRVCRLRGRGDRRGRI